MSQWDAWRVDKVASLEHESEEAISSATDLDDALAAAKEDEKNARILVERLSADAHRLRELIEEKSSGMFSKLSRLFTADQTPSPSAEVENYEAALKRLNGADSMNKVAKARLNDLTSKVAGRREHRHLTHPTRMLEIEHREHALRLLTEEIVSDPSMLFKGIKAIEDRYDRLLAWRRASGEVVNPTLKPKGLA